MDNLSLTDFLNIKISTLIAGLLGAFVASLRKSEGTLQARLGGYAMAVVTILYAVPFLIFLFEHYGYPLHSTAENLLSFIFGTISKGLTEQFIDDPTGTIKRWAANIRLFRRLFSLPDSNSEKKEQENES